MDFEDIEDLIRIKELKRKVIKLQEKKFLDFMANKIWFDNKSLAEKERTILNQLLERYGVRRRVSSARLIKACTSAKVPIPRYLKIKKMNYGIP